MSCKLHERVLSFTQKAMISGGSILSKQESSLKEELEWIFFFFSKYTSVILYREEEWDRVRNIDDRETTGGTHTGTKGDGAICVQPGRCVCVLSLSFWLPL